MICSVCGSYNNLHVHHLSYSNTTLEFVGNELLSDVVVLCKDCHKDAHKGKIVFIITKEEDVSISINRSRIICKGANAVCAITESDITLREWFEGGRGSIGGWSNKSKLLTDISYGKFKNFIWIRSDKHGVMFPGSRIQNISRFVYAASYVKYNGSILKHPTSKISPMDESMLVKTMALEYNTYRSWKKDMIDLGYMRFTDDHIVINRDYANAGLAQMHTSGYSTRVFIDGIRDVYAATSVAEHRKISLPFLLLPHINPHFNCLCGEIDERNPSNIVPASPKDISNSLGVSEKRCKALLECALDLRFNENKEAVIKKHEFNDQGSVYVINPRLMFSGNESEFSMVTSIFSENKEVK